MNQRDKEYFDKIKKLLESANAMLDGLQVSLANQSAGQPATADDAANDQRISDNEDNVTSMGQPASADGAVSNVPDYDEGGDVIPGNLTAPVASKSDAKGTKGVSARSSNTSGVSR